MSIIVVEVENLKQKSIELFSKGGFNFHKWHLNIPLLENDNANKEQTYAKQLFSSNSGHTKILGLGWNKTTDKMNIEIRQFNERQITKRNILSYIASIYDPLGLISSNHVMGKLIYRGLCDLKIPWDEETPDILKRKFKKWVQDITCNKIVLSRAKPLKLESVTAMNLHVFGDAGIIINCAVVIYTIIYTIAYEPSNTHKELLVRKS